MENFIFIQLITQLLLRDVGVDDTGEKIILWASRNLNCSSQAVISQQLVNYIRTVGDPKITLTSEGRGGVFIFCDIAFHQYNSFTYNDSLLKNMGLIAEESENLYKIAELPGYVKLGGYKSSREYEKYSLFPEIAMRKDNSFSCALTIPLNEYIRNSLKYQRSLPVESRIVFEGVKASDQQIDTALLAVDKVFIKEGKKQDKAAPSFSPMNPASVDVEQSEFIAR